MNDKELADRIVALGVGKANQIYPDALGRFYQIDPDADWQTSVNEAKFVRDWRVAGALMEKVQQLSYHWFAPKPPGGWWSVVIGPDGYEGEGDNLPRAINEACCEALGE